MNDSSLCRGREPEGPQHVSAVLSLCGLVQALYALRASLHAMPAPRASAIRAAPPSTTARDLGRVLRYPRRTAALQAYCDPLSAAIISITPSI